MFCFYISSATSEQNKLWSISTPCHSQHVVKPNWLAPQQSSFKKHDLLTEKNCSVVDLASGLVDSTKTGNPPPVSPRYRRCQLKPRPGRRETWIFKVSPIGSIHGNGIFECNKYHKNWSNGGRYMPVSWIFSGCWLEGLGWDLPETKNVMGKSHPELCGWSTCLRWNLELELRI